jgi:excisionase family DNA binding protein
MTTSAVPEPLMSVQDVAEWLKVRPSWVFDHHGEGALPAIQVGRHLRFRREEVEAWLTSQR